mmetsp:Transcript_3458/g.12467  ORF Transcript_3458/g.12467 Transcript_3458/m.12467 type:complete len:259 (-) Transcript_3458:1089-1865(-)
MAHDRVQPHLGALGADKVGDDAVLGEHARRRADDRGAEAHGLAQHLRQVLERVDPLQQLIPRQLRPALARILLVGGGVVAFIIWRRSAPLPPPRPWLGTRGGEDARGVDLLAQLALHALVLRQGGRHMRERGGGGVHARRHEAQHIAHHLVRAQRPCLRVARRAQHVEQRGARPPPRAVVLRRTAVCSGGAQLPPLLLHKRTTDCVQLAHPRMHRAHLGGGDDVPPRGQVARPAGHADHVHHLRHVLRRVYAELLQLR